MMKTIRIEGKIVYMPIEGGFWGVIDDKGNEWLPMDMPDELKKDGLMVILEVRKIKDAFSIYNWGMPVEILASQLA